MGLREIQEKLHEMQVNATGATSEAIFSVLSLPHATLSGLVNTVQGKSFTEAADAVVNEYAAVGEKIGRQQSDLIVGILKDVAIDRAKEAAKNKKKL